MKPGLDEGCVFRGRTPGPPHLTASTSPGPGLTKSTREAESRNWDGEDSLYSSVLPLGAHRSPYPTWLCARRISRLCFHSEALPLAVHMLPSGSRFISFSAARPARRGLSQGRRLARAGRGAGIPETGRAGLGGRRRAHRRPSERPPAGPAEAGPHGVPPPVPGISAAEKPGRSGRQKEVLGDPRLRPDPAPGQRTWGTAGLCRGHRSLQFSGRRAFPASERRGTSSQPAQLPAFHLGPAERPADLDAGNSGLGAPPWGRPLGRGDLSLCPPPQPPGGDGASG